MTRRSIPALICIAFLSKGLFIQNGIINGEKCLRQNPKSITIGALQQKNPEIRSQLNPEIEKYYKFINLASREIYKNNYFSAASFYDSAFQHRAHPNFVDLKNYLFVNMKCGLFSKNNAPIRLLLIDKQIDTSFFFKQIPERVFSAENLTTINKIQKEKKKRKETALQKALRDIFVSDQIAHGYKGYDMSDRSIAKMMYARKDSVDQVNVSNFIQLYKKEGFPTEEKVGVFYEEDCEWSFVTYILLWHFVRGEKRDEILSIMHQELKVGNLHPSLYASILDIVHENQKVQRPEFNFMNTTYNLMDGYAYRPFVYYSDSLMKEVNTNRISIGLDSFHITQKELLCENYCKKAIKQNNVIPMAQYTKIEEYSYGFIKAAFDKEKQDLSLYKINTKKIIEECNCQEKTY